ncbi:MAG: flagellar biosynthesis protein FlhA [Candidatus Tectomicrobia bacterium RIFCSPLOWO2_12_FULL_69_37]|nr:MAG: flagellar biosynthesis protein FlhA [Candidatus Tectomicrobia bacterium RIFCSPLOWO2_12_FULL_69_37]OGL64266.1 MAG: flagellar biosynthesis protein FlhA [Candidatus Tectomicrobia bacterium RIFCSPLOWO2_02_FULL_70_19]
MNEAAGIARLTRNSDIAMALGMVGILVVMIVPVPPPMLDALLSFSITFGLVVLLVSLYTTEPLEFSVFPSLLLVTTLFRLSLNVASTRLILMQGNEGPGAAGQVIQAFGNFVVGGNYVVGLVVFLILVIINFVVITKGAGRVAEVAARFTLDAIPGKQMAIDADLNAGLINEGEARRRRVQISREADFFGAMDGASKFVRGDAIAGLIITFINLLGGLAIGVFQQGMPLARAASTYAILTVGDGLVAQIPALLISTAAGIVVTRSADQNHLGATMAAQLLGHTRAIGVASGLLFVLGMFPGLPQLPFFMLAGLTGGVAYYLTQAKQAEVRRQEEEIAAKPVQPAVPAPESVDALLQVDLMELDVGYSLIPLVDARQNGELLDRIRSIRRQFAHDMGLVVPPLHIRDNLQLKPGEYAILLKGVDVARGEIMMDHFMAMDTGSVESPVPGIPTTEPAFGLPAIWITPANKERAQLAGYTVVEPATVVATHLTEMVKKHGHELLTRSEVQRLLEKVGQTHAKVVEELVPNLLSLGKVQKVLQNLVREGVNIRDMVTILEALADYAVISQDGDVLTEYVRSRLARGLTSQHAADTGAISVITLDPEVERSVVGALQHTEHGSYLALDPALADRLLRGIQGQMERFETSSTPPVLLASPAIRGHLRKFIERFIPQLAILSHNEIAPGVRIQSLGSVRLT